MEHTRLVAGLSCDKRLLVPLPRRSAGLIASSFTSVFTARAPGLRNDWFASALVFTASGADGCAGAGGGSLRARRVRALRVAVVVVAVAVAVLASAAMGTVESAEEVSLAATSNFSFSTLKSEMPVTGFTSVLMFAVGTGADAGAVEGASAGSGSCERLVEAAAALAAASRISRRRARRRRSRSRLACLASSLSRRFGRAF